MNTILAICLLGQCGSYRPVCEAMPNVWYQNPWVNRERSVGYWWFMYAPDTWNQSVNELRMARASATRPQLSSEDQANLQELASEKDRLWLELIEAKKQDKPLIREEYLKVKTRLDIARLSASRKLRTKFP